MGHKRPASAGRKRCCHRTCYLRRLGRRPRPSSQMVRPCNPLRPAPRHRQGCVTPSPLLAQQPALVIRMSGTERAHTAPCLTFHSGQAICRLRCHLQLISQVAYLAFSRIQDLSHRYVHRPLAYLPHSCLLHPSILPLLHPTSLSIAPRLLRSQYYKLGSLLCTSLASTCQR